jgi:hypothetical protein
MTKKPLMRVILQGLALAMGAAAAVLSLLGGASSEALVTVLGIGLFALAVDALGAR